MIAVKSLVEACIDAVTQHIPYQVHLACSAVPVPDLVQRIYYSYMRLHQWRCMSGRNTPTAHLDALRQFATCWSPAVLSIRLRSTSSQTMNELSAFASSLVHLELSCVAASGLQALTTLTGLQCLSLKGCEQLQQVALEQVLTALPQLSALDLSGLQAVSDSLAPALATLTQLRVLQINRTSCSDTTVEYLTYGHRLHEWQQQQQSIRHQKQQQQQHGGHAGTAVAVPVHADHSLQQSQQHREWPRTMIRQWHLAHTRVTAKAAKLLLSCPDLVFIDLRGSGVKASQLVPLRTKFALSAVQGAVLTRSAAMASAAVSHDMFVCTNLSEHGTAAAEAATAEAAGSSPSLQQWVQQGVVALLQAKNDVLTAEAETAAEAARKQQEAKFIAWQEHQQRLLHPNMYQNAINVPSWQGAAGMWLPPWQQQ